MAEKLLKVGTNKFGVATSLKSDPNDFVYVSSDSRNIERVIGGISAGQEGEKVIPIFGLGLKHLETTPNISNTFPSVSATGGYVAVAKGGVVYLYNSNMQLLRKSKKMSEGSIVEVVVGDNGVYVITSLGDSTKNSISLYPFNNLDIPTARVSSDLGSYDRLTDVRSGQNLSLGANGDVLVVSTQRATLFSRDLSLKWAVAFNNSDRKLSNTPISNMVGGVRACLLLADGTALISTILGKIHVNTDGDVIRGVVDDNNTALASAYQWNNKVYQVGSGSGVWEVDLKTLTSKLILGYMVGGSTNGVRFAKLSDDGFLYVSRSGGIGLMATISKYDLNSLRFVWELSSKFIDSKNAPSIGAANYCALAVDNMGYIYAVNEAYTMMVTENLVLKGYEVNL